MKNSAMVLETTKKQQCTVKSLYISAVMDVNAVILFSHGDY